MTEPTPYDDYGDDVRELAEMLAENKMVAIPYGLACQIDGELSAIAHGHGSPDLAFCNLASGTIRRFAEYCHAVDRKNQRLASLIRLAASRATKAEEE